MTHNINNGRDSAQKDSMEINWDLIINFVVLTSIILFAVSKVTNKTLGELFAGMREFILDTREDIQEKSEELVYYE